MSDLAIAPILVPLVAGVLLLLFRDRSLRGRRVLGLLSVAVQVTVVVPIVNCVPLAGTQTTVVPGQLSDVVGSANFTVAPHTFASFATVTFAGHVIVHAGCTVIVNVHVPVFAAASVAVHVTVVTPTGNDEPDTGTQLTVAPGQLSVAVGVV